MILSSDVSALIDGPFQEIAGSHAKNAPLKQEVLDLRRRLGKNDPRRRRSHKPPSLGVTIIASFMASWLGWIDILLEPG